MTPPSSDGSSGVTSYQLQVKFPGEDVWRTVLGETQPNLMLRYTLFQNQLTAGQYVQARYRCINEIGWSAWSPHDYLLMAGVPNTPNKPTYISSTATTITIQL
jgi:hypothetical protein